VGGEGHSMISFVQMLIDKGYTVKNKKIKIEGEGRIVEANLRMKIKVRPTVKLGFNFCKNKE
jgi:hypothetical protein